MRSRIYSHVILLVCLLLSCFVAVQCFAKSEKSPLVVRVSLLGFYFGRMRKGVSMTFAHDRFSFRVYILMTILLDLRLGCYRNLKYYNVLL